MYTLKVVRIAPEMLCVVSSVLDVRAGTRMASLLHVLALLVECLLHSPTSVGSTCTCMARDEGHRAEYNTNLPQCSSRNHLARVLYGKIALHVHDWYTCSGARQEHVMSKAGTRQRTYTRSLMNHRHSCWYFDSARHQSKVQQKFGVNVQSIRCNTPGQFYR